MTKPKEHPEVKHGKKGVLVVNLGTPDSLKLLDIRRYLKECHCCGLLCHFERAGLPMLEARVTRLNCGGSDSLAGSGRTVGTQIILGV